MLHRLLGSLVTFVGLIALWQIIVWVTDVPPFILPDPLMVLSSLTHNLTLIGGHALYTLTEIVLGLFFGTVLGITAALIMIGFHSAQRWILPVLVISQAIPVFALAPLLVLWLGYGMASKVAMATLIIFFPITSSLYDSLCRTDSAWVDLARTMGGRSWDILWYIRLPASLPSLSSGIRVAVAVAPIGAVVGEWIGSAAGLGYLMLQANARLQTDLMFAALFVLALVAVSLYVLVDNGLKWMIPWQSETLHLNRRK